MTGVLAVRIHADDHILGRLDAPLTLLQFGDYQCPACAMAFPVVQALLEQNDDRVCFVFRHFPLSRMHLLAAMAAQVAEGAGTMGRFWQMHEWLYVNQAAWSKAGAAGVARGAQTIGLTPTALQRALDDKGIADHVRRDFTGGVRSGVTATPSFFLNGRLYPGGFDTLGDAVSAAIERADPAMHPGRDRPPTIVR